MSTKAYSLEEIRAMKAAVRQRRLELFGHCSVGAPVVRKRETPDACTDGMDYWAKENKKSLGNDYARDLSSERSIRAAIIENRRRRQKG